MADSNEVSKMALLTKKVYVSPSVHVPVTRALRDSARTAAQVPGWHLHTLKGSSE